MSDFYSNDELRHFGVKGMRWGHRKAKQEYKNAVKKAKAKYDNDPEVVARNTARAQKRARVGKEATKGLLATLGTFSLGMVATGISGAKGNTADAFIFSLGTMLATPVVALNSATKVITEAASRR